MHREAVQVIGGDLHIDLKRVVAPAILQYLQGAAPSIIVYLGDAFIFRAGQRSIKRFNVLIRGRRPWR
ncbi:hypothetical protein D3C79_932780 [compost metagenome]